MKHNKETLYTLIFFFVLSFLFLIIFFSITKIATPAYYSVIANCYPDRDILNNSGYRLAGSLDISASNLSENINLLTTQDLYNTSKKLNLAITLYTNKTSVLRHELCHMEQYNEKRLYSCDNIKRLYFNEVECYIQEFNIFYAKEEINKFINNKN